VRGELLAQLENPGDCLAHCLPIAPVFEDNPGRRLFVFGNHNLFASRHSRQKLSETGFRLKCGYVLPYIVLRKLTHLFANLPRRPQLRHKNAELLA